MIGDDTGQNISGQNPFYCELTALYWAWKNDHDSAHIGLMHYRRVLDFDGSFARQSRDTQAEHFVLRFDIAQWLDGTQAWLDAHGRDYDVIVPPLHVMGRTVVQNYREGHAPGDLDLTRDIIAARHPEYLPSFDAVCAGYGVRLGNIMVMRRDVMDDYCTWLFDILGTLEGWDVDRSAYSPEQSRYLGFVAERLLTVYVHHMQAIRSDLRLREAAILNLSQALVVPYLNDDSLNGPSHVNIACAADRDYLPHTAAMLQSLLTRADPARQINVFFLSSGITPQDTELLTEVIALHPRARLHMLPVDRAFARSYRSSSRAPSNATYNRFLLFDLLPSLERLLYVDGDMIFHGDVCEIYDTDMGEAQIAAVPDYIMMRTLSGPTPTIDPNVPDLAVYQRDVLGLDATQMGRYFNAGLLLMHFAAMDVAATGRALMAQAQTGRYLFRDQDILNMHFKDSLMLLDGRYNVFNTQAEGYGRVPSVQRAAAMAARRDPFVTHYAAGDYKPWGAASVPHAHHYWAAIAQTPFYGEVLGLVAAQTRKRAAPHRRAQAWMIETSKGVALRYPKLRPFLVRGYQRLRWVLHR